MKKLLLSLSLLFTSLTFAHSTIDTANNYQTVRNIVSQAKNPAHWLIVLDDDDTLTRMPCNKNHCQYLGSSAWYIWQNHLNPNDPQRVAPTSDRFNAIASYLISISNMSLTEKDVPAVLQAAHQRGMHIIVETARGDDLIPATERQLTQNGVLPIIKNSAIRTKNNHISFAGPYLPEKISGLTTNRPVAYQNGVMYVTGQNKGILLKDFLQKTGAQHSITHIIFMDDMMQNVKDVAAAYQNDPAVTMISLHYMKTKKQQIEFAQSKTLQAEATAQWKNLHSAGKENLIGYAY